jgi:ankyrin repeat protein
MRSGLPLGAPLSLPNLQKLVPSVDFTQASLTPLMVACDKGNADIVTFIVRKGADVTATDKVTGLPPKSLKTLGVRVMACVLLCSGAGHP